MQNYINFVVDYPKTVISILVAITIILGVGIKNLEFDSSVDVMMPKNDKRYIQNEKVKQIYGNIGKFVLISINDTPLFSPKVFRRMEAFTEDIKEFQYYDDTRETNRLNILHDFIAKKQPVKTSELLDSAGDDLPFYRYLTRTVKRLFKDHDDLSAKNLLHLEKDFQHTLKIKKRCTVDDIVSVLSAQDISGKDDTLSPIELIDKDENGDLILPETPDDFAILKKRLFQNPAFKNSLFSATENNEITDFSILVKLKNVKKDDIVGEEIWKISEGYDDLHPILQGIPIMNKFMNDYTKRDFKNYMPLVILLVMSVFYLNFKSLRGVFLPMVGLLIADIWIMGLMGHLKMNVTIMSVSLPSLMVAIGSSYAIHILNQYYIDFKDITRLGKSQGLKESMNHISVTVFLAGFTTFVGFCSIQTNQVTGIREWGLFSAIGVMFTVVISTSLIPAVLAILPHRQSFLSQKLFGDTEKSWIDPVLDYFTVLSTKHYKKVMAVIFVIVVISLIGLSKVKVETDIMSYFKSSDYMRVSSKYIGDKYGGAVGLSILIDSGESNGILTPLYLKTIDDLSAFLTAEENRSLSVGTVISFATVMKSMHQAMNNDNPAFYRIPDSKYDILDYMELFSGDDKNSDGRIDDFEPLVDPDYRTAMVFAKLWEKNGHLIGTNDVKHIEAGIEAYLNKHLPPQYTYTITGEPTLIVALSDYVISGQLSSLLFCLIAVCIIIILLFKNWKAGILSLIPMSFAVTINFGIMGWFKVNLDTATAIIASVAVGIGIDDTIHFLNTYRHFRAEGASIDDAITRTLHISGKAITYTSLALILGYSVLSVSNFKPMILSGILTGITMFATTIGALVVLPSTIKFTGVRLQGSTSDSLFWKYFYIGRYFNLKA